MSQTKAQLIDNLVQPITGALGSASAPTFSFTTDPNTGIYSPGADQLAISTNGTGRLFVGSAGDVGIGGAPSGSYKLEVKAGAIDSAAIFDSTNFVGSHVRFSTSGTDRHYLGSAPGFTASGTSSDFAIRTAGYLALLTGGNNERLRITSAGLVGIGTSSPASLLHVTASSGDAIATIGTAYPLTLWTNATTVTPAIYTKSGSDIRFGTTTDGITATGFAENFRFTSTGRLGIGTTSPLNKFVVSNGGAAGLEMAPDGFSGNPVIVSYNRSGTAYTQLTLDGASNVFAISGTERARIDSSGRLLLGTSSTSANTRLVVQGSSLGSGSPALQHLCFDGATPASGDGLGFLIFGDNSQSQGAWITARRDGGTWSGSSKPSRLEFSTTADGASSPTERMRIRSSGEVLVNSTALLDLTGQSFQVNGWSMFYQATGGTTASAFTHIQSGTQTVCLFRQGNPAATVGSITVSGGTTTTYNTSSDYRLKENIVNISDGIDRLLQLKPSRFNFISNPGKTVDGFVAHEVQDIVPEAITGDKDAVDDDGNPIYQGIDQSKLVPLLTAALQEAVIKIKDLENRLAAAGI